MTSKKKPEIREVVYEVTGYFGSNEVGDLRRAFIVAGDLQSDREHIMLFHPKDKDGSGCLELSKQNPTTGYFESFKKALYINLSVKEEKRYRAMVEVVLGSIPSSLSIEKATLEQAQLNESLPKRRAKKSASRL